jgi:hypothetical protein
MLNLAIVKWKAETKGFVRVLSTTKIQDFMDQETPFNRSFIEFL